jgi:hypothetical protein
LIARKFADSIAPIDIGSGGQWQWSSTVRIVRTQFIPPVIVTPPKIVIGVDWLAGNGRLV